MHFDVQLADALLDRIIVVDAEVAVLADGLGGEGGLGAQQLGHVQHVGLVLLRERGRKHLRKRERERESFRPVSFIIPCRDAAVTSVILDDTSGGCCDDYGNSTSCRLIFRFYSQPVQ